MQLTTTSPTSRTDALFSPTTFAGIPLGSSFAMAPMTRFRAPAGVPTAEVAEYYRRRAAGGVGLLVTEGVLLDHPSAGSEAAAPRLGTPGSVEGWSEVVRAVHGAGGRLVAQLWHQGSERDPRDGQEPWTPSGEREDGSPAGRAMTARDIVTLLERFSRAARAARAAGFDGIEIHAAHGYLLDEFLWAATNRREDRYGGGPQGRTRLVTEVIAAIREAVGPDLPVGVRFSQFKERLFTARIAEDPGEFAALLEPWVAAGATFLHASTRRAWEPAFEGSERTLAGWARTLTGLPTIAVGSVGLEPDALLGGGPASLAHPADLRERGEFDVLALWRALLANPRLVEHARAGRRQDLTPYRKAHEGLFP